MLAKLILRSCTPSRAQNDEFAGSLIQRVLEHQRTQQAGCGGRRRWAVQHRAKSVETGKAFVESGFLAPLDRFFYRQQRYHRGKPPVMSFYPMPYGMTNPNPSPSFERRSSDARYTRTDLARDIRDEPTRLSYLPAKRPGRRSATALTPSRWSSVFMSQVCSRSSCRVCASTVSASLSRRVARVEMIASGALSATSAASA